MTDINSLQVKAEVKHKKCLKKIEAITVRLTEPELKAWVGEYEKIALLFCLPKFSKLDPKSLSHRLKDMIGGFPFTSQSFPWPSSAENGSFLQPIFQINLQQASELLNEDFGSGHLQLWGAIGRNPFHIRIIPIESTTEPLDLFQPDFNKNQQHGGNVVKSTPEDGYLESRLRMLDFEPHLLATPCVSWVPEGKMFPVDGSFIHSTLPDEMWDKGYELNEKLVAILPSPFSGVYLGGFGGSHGGDSDPMYVDPNKGKLLVRVTDEGNRSVGIVASHDDSGMVRFKAIDRY